MTKNIFKILILIITFLTNNNTYAGQSCIGDARIYFKHLRALELLQETERLINNPVLHPNVITGLNRYFKLNNQDAGHAELIKTVFANINKVNGKSEKADYRCDPENKTGPCTDTNIAGTKSISIFKRKIYLCPGYFTKINETQKVGVILHQWFHAFGGKKIARAKEKFCRDAETNNAEILIKQADQYMQFIYFVGSNGTVLPCF